MKARKAVFSSPRSATPFPVLRAFTVPAKVKASTENCPKRSEIPATTPTIPGPATGSCVCAAGDSSPTTTTFPATYQTSPPRKGTHLTDQGEKKGRLVPTPSRTQIVPPPPPLPPQPVHVADEAPHPARSMINRTSVTTLLYDPQAPVPEEAIFPWGMGSTPLAGRISEGRPRGIGTAIEAHARGSVRIAARLPRGNGRRGPCGLWPASQSPCGTVGHI